MNELVHEQPVPKYVAGNRATWPKVVADLKARMDRQESALAAQPIAWVLNDAIDRDLEGRRRYGVPLQPGNGRDSLVDAYQELLDAAVYLRNEMIEHPAPPNDLRLRQAYERTLNLAIEVRGLIAERRGGLITMGQYGVKLVDPRDEQAYYLHWSEIVDAPVFIANTLEGYKEYIRNRFGSDGIAHMERGNRFTLLESTGVSTPRYGNAADAVAFNRAGPNERQLSVGELIELCRRELAEDGQ